MKVFKVELQTILNILIGTVGLLFGFLLNAIWASVKDLQTSDKEIVTKINAIEVLVAGDYVKQTDFKDHAAEINRKLDNIANKLDNKADK